MIHIFNFAFAAQYLLFAMTRENSFRAALHQDNYLCFWFVVVLFFKATKLGQFLRIP